MVDKKDTPEEKISSRIWSPPGFNKYIRQLSHASPKKKIKEIVSGLALLILFCVAWFALSWLVLTALKENRWDTNLFILLIASSSLGYGVVKISEYGK